jgi:hypothetical protein
LKRIIRSTVGVKGGNSFFFLKLKPLLTPEENILKAAAEAAAHAS